MPIGSSSDLSDAQILPLKKGNLIKIVNIKKEQVWWILYKASAYRSGDIGLNVWTSVQRWSQSKIDKVLAAEEAERQRLANIERLRLEEIKRKEAERLAEEERLRKA